MKSLWDVSLGTGHWVWFRTKSGYEKCFWMPPWSLLKSLCNILLISISLDSTDTFYLELSARTRDSCSSLWINVLSFIWQQDLQVHCFSFSLCLLGSPEANERLVIGKGLFPLLGIVPLPLPILFSFWFLSDCILTCIGVIMWNVQYKFIEQIKPENGDFLHKLRHLKLS